MAKKIEINVGLFGLGTVGSAVLEYLEKEYNEEKTGVKINIKKIVVKDLKKNRGKKFDSYIISDNIEDILLDKDINLVIELIGGYEPARTLILKSFENKKDVVTANKAVISKFGIEILKKAIKTKRNLAYQAAACGETRIINELSNIPSYNIEKIIGIVNGTTNYILSLMEDGMEFNEALEDAREKGYTEADESLDIDGVDAAHKLIILTANAFGKFPEYNNINIEGISQIEKEDIKYANKLGYKIKPIVLAAKRDDIFELRVSPALISKSSTLSSVKYDNNGVSIYIKNKKFPRIIIGSGSGGRPTANSVITDVVDLANRESSKQINNYFNSIASKMEAKNINNNIIFDDYSLYYYVRLLVSNSPGVLYNITKILSKNNINVSNAIQSEKSEIGTETPLILTLETRDQKSIDKAMNELNKMTIIKKSIKIMILE